MVWYMEKIAKLEAENAELKAQLSQERQFNSEWAEKMKAKNADLRAKCHDLEEALGKKKKKSLRGFWEKAFWRPFK